MVGWPRDNRTRSHAGIAATRLMDRYHHSVPLVLCRRARLWRARFSDGKPSDSDLLAFDLCLRYGSDALKATSLVILRDQIE